MANEKQSRIKGVTQVVVVTLFLVAMPLATFIVQSTGAAEGRALYKDLKQNLGLLPKNFAATNYSGQSFQSSELHGQTLVVSWATPQSRDSVLALMKTIDRIPQFQEEVDNLQFVTFDTGTDSMFFKNYYINLTRNEREKWQILRGGADIQQNVKLPNDYIVALVDTSGIIRRFYDIREQDECRKLVEHISIMPLRKKKTIEKKDQKQM